MESRLRQALLAWLRADAWLAANLNAIEAEAPVAATMPWLGIVASASADWSTKSGRGREVRVALELQTRGDDHDARAELVAAIEDRIAALPKLQDGFVLTSLAFLRARTERRRSGTHATLVEYRFRILTPIEE